MIRLLLNDILSFHERPEKTSGIRDLGLIESAVNAPFQTFGGNKRVALHALTVYLKIYGSKMNCSQAERISVTMKVAASKMSAEEFLAWLKSKIN